MKKSCCFYASEYHLLTMLLPHIQKKLDENKKIELFLEKDMTEYVKRYLKLNDIFDNSAIMKLGWKKVKSGKINLETGNIIVVIGKESFINEITSVLDKLEKSFEVINCYNIEEILDIEKIVNKHEYILKTSGEYENKKSSHNEQKRKTIQTQI